VDGLGADAPGKVESGAGQDLGLVEIRTADASQVQLAAIDEGQHDVAALDAGKRVGGLSFAKSPSPRLLLLVDDAILHHEGDARHLGDVLDRVAVHSHQIGELAWLKAADAVVPAEQIGGDAGG